MRGALDPRLEGGRARSHLKKQLLHCPILLKGTHAFGLTMKAEVDNAAGAYLNPESNTGNDRLYAVGRAGSRKRIGV